MQIEPYKLEGKNYYSFNQITGLLDFPTSRIYKAIEKTKLPCRVLSIPNKNERKYVEDKYVEKIVNYIKDNSNVKMTYNLLYRSLKYAKRSFEKVPHKEKGLKKFSKVQLVQTLSEPVEVFEKPTVKDFWSLQNLVNKLANRIGLN